MPSTVFQRTAYFELEDKGVCWSDNALVTTPLGNMVEQFHHFDTDAMVDGNFAVFDPTSELYKVDKMQQLPDVAVIPGLSDGIKLHDITRIIRNRAY